MMKAEKAMTLQSSQKRRCRKEEMLYTFAGQILGYRFASVMTPVPYLWRQMILEPMSGLCISLPYFSNAGQCWQASWEIMPSLVGQFTV
jgi:hypothetical protein